MNGNLISIGAITAFALASVPMMLFVFWMLSRSDPVVNFSASDLVYDASIPALRWKAGFLVKKNCEWSAHHEIAGPDFVITVRTPRAQTILGRVDNLPISVKLLKPLRPGNYRLYVFLEHWCNPVQRAMDWPIRMQIEHEFRVPNGN